MAYAYASLPVKHSSVAFSQPVKASGAMVQAPEGMVHSSSLVFCAKAWAPIVWILSGSATVSATVYCIALSPTAVSMAGKVIFTGRRT